MILCGAVLYLFNKIEDIYAITRIFKDLNKQEFIKQYLCNMQILIIKDMRIVASGWRISSACLFFGSTINLFFNKDIQTSISNIIAIVFNNIRPSFWQ